MQHNDLRSLTTFSTELLAQKISEVQQNGVLGGKSLRRATLDSRKLKAVIAVPSLIFGTIVIGMAGRLPR